MHYVRMNESTKIRKFKRSIANRSLSRVLIDDIDQK